MNRVMNTAALAAGIILASVSNASAFELLDRVMTMGGGKSGCCEPACGAKSSCATKGCSSCSRGRVKRMRSCGCDSGKGAVQKGARQKGVACNYLLRRS